MDTDKPIAAWPRHAMPKRRHGATTVARCASPTSAFRFTESARTKCRAPPSPSAVQCRHRVGSAGRASGWFVITVRTTRFDTTIISLAMDKYFIEVILLL